MKRLKWILWTMKRRRRIWCRCGWRCRWYSRCKSTNNLWKNYWETNYVECCCWLFERTQAHYKIHTMFVLREPEVLAPEQPGPGRMNFATQHQNAHIVAVFVYSPNADSNLHVAGDGGSNWKNETVKTTNIAQFDSSSLAASSLISFAFNLIESFEKNSGSKWNS